MRRDETGASLLEVMVTCLMLSAVMAVLLQFLDQTTAVTARTTKHVRTETAAQLALRTLTQELRGAKTVRPCASGAYSTCVVLDLARPAASTAPACPLRTVTFKVVSGEVRQDRVDYPTCGAPTTRYANRVLLANVANGATPVFSYFALDGNPIDIATKPGDVPTAASVQVRLTVSTTARNAPPLQYTATAALRNNR